MTAEQPPPAAEPVGLRIALVSQSPLAPDQACLAAAKRAAKALEAAGHRCEPVAWDPVPVAEGYRVVRRVSIAAFPLAPEELGARVRPLAEEGLRISGVEYFRAHQRATAVARRSFTPRCRRTRRFEPRAPPSIRRT